ncbi:hypothetical protein WJ971_25425 [Achromobacter xylosoxidans]
MTADEIWQVLDYLRVHAYGVNGGAGMPAVPAPVVALSCRDGRAVTLAGLRGLPLRVVAAMPGAPPEPQDPRLLTVALTRGGPLPGDADCAAVDEDAWNAYALAAGLAPQGWRARSSWSIAAAGCGRGACRARRRPGPARTTSAGRAAAWRTPRRRAWARCCWRWIVPPSGFRIRAAGGSACSGGMATRHPGTFPFHFSHTRGRQDEHVE